MSDKKLCTGCGKFVKPKTQKIPMCKRDELTGKAVDASYKIKICPRCGCKIGIMD